MYRHIAVVGLLACGAAFSANAASVTNTLFSDNFDGEFYEFNTTLDNWTVVQGSVDVVNCSGSGNCVDLDGSMSGSLPTIIETKASFAYAAGRTYNVVFDIPTGTQTDSITFAFGSVVENLYENYSFPLTTFFSGIATSDGFAQLRISLGSVTNNNFGPYLTSISLVETYVDGGLPPLAPVPLPASGLLLLGGIGAMRLWKRGRAA